jgi:hypothetical protein
VTVRDGCDAEEARSTRPSCPPADRARQAPALGQGDRLAGIVVIFEGRDAAGKGGVIKRITERTNPRIVRTVALGTPSDREKTQWYFQRYVEQLPAAGEIVLFDRSWYNRAGVERVMGFATEEQVASSCAPAPSSSGCWCARDPDRQVLVLDQRRGAGAPLPGPQRGPDQALEAVPDGPRVPGAVAGLLARQGRDVRHTDIKQAPWWVVDADVKRTPGSTASRTCSTSSTTPTRHPSRSTSARDRTTRRVRPPADGGPDLRPRALLTTDRRPSRDLPTGSPARRRSSSAAAAATSSTGSPRHLGVQPTEQRRGELIGHGTDGGSSRAATGRRAAVREDDEGREDGQVIHQRPQPADHA